MSTEEYKPPLPYDIVTKYISEEELELLQKLEGKLKQAEQALSEEAQNFANSNKLVPQIRQTKRKYWGLVHIW